MKFLIYFLMLNILSLPAFAGEWTRIDVKTVSFKGVITDTEFKNFEKVFDEDVEVLIVNSGGGETMAAIEIAEVIYDAELEVRVQQVCASSCANYFFTAAKKRVIENGIVGFHGNMQACFGGKKWNAFIKMLKDNGITGDRLEELKTRFKKNFEIEKHFLQKVGVSQELFEVSCTDDKGMNDGNVYSLLLPLPQTFEFFGIHGVIGEQSREIIEKMNEPVAIW